MQNNLNFKNISDGLPKEYAEKLFSDFIDMKYLSGIKFLLKTQDFNFLEKQFIQKFSDVIKADPDVQKVINQHMKMNEQKHFNVLLNTIQSPSDVEKYDFSFIKENDLICYAITSKNPQHLIAMEKIIQNKKYDLNSIRQEIFPLHHACQKNNLEAIKILIKNGANINLLDFNTVPPIMYSVLNRDIETFNYLVDAGADINTIVYPNKIAKIVGEETNIASFVGEIIEQYQREIWQTKDTKPFKKSILPTPGQNINDNKNIKQAYQVPVYFYLSLFGSRLQKDIDFSVNALIKVAPQTNLETTDNIGQNILFYLIRNRNIFKAKQIGTLKEILNQQHDNFFRQKNQLGNTSLYYIETAKSGTSEWLEMVQDRIDFSTQNIYGKRYLDCLKQEKKKNVWINHIETLTQKNELALTVSDHKSAKKFKL